MDSADLVLYDVSDGVCTLILNNPDFTRIITGPSYSPRIKAIFAI